MITLELDTHVEPSPKTCILWVLLIGTHSSASDESGHFSIKRVIGTTFDSLRTAIFAARYHPISKCSYKNFLDKHRNIVDIKYTSQYTRYYGFQIRYYHLSIYLLFTYS